MKLKGGPIPISEKARYSNAREEGRVDKTGKVIAPSIPAGPDMIEKSLTLRLSQPG